MKNNNRTQLILTLVVVIASTISISAQNIDTTPAGSKTKKGREAARQNTPISGVSIDFQMKRSFEELQAKKSELEMKIDNLTHNVNSAKPAKAKKYRKELIVAQNEYDVVVRKLETYPKSLTDSSFEAERVNREAEELKRQMTEKKEQKIAAVETRDILEDENDPELRRAYEKFQNGDYEETEQTSRPYEGTTYFTVQIASGRSGQASTFRGLNETVEENRVKNGYAYTAGRYSSLSQAQTVCKEIKSTTRYRDAYVVAFSNGQRVTLDEAARLMR